MKLHFIYKTFISFLLAFLMVVPASIQAAQPKDDNTSPYFESAAVRDSFMNCKKPIWTNNWDDLPADTLQKHFVEFNNDPKYGNMTFRELRNRRALTGESCTINKLIGVVGVGSWTKNLGALTDDSLDNYAEIKSVVKAGVTVNPIVSVRDMDNYYSKGTVAGYAVVAGSGSSLLTLDVIKTYSIGFYRDGVLQGVKAVREGQDGSGVTLKLLQIPGTNNVSIMLTAQSDWLFDEITLDCSGGVQADVANLMEIRYAFVGEPTEFTITDGGIKNFNNYSQGQNDIALSKMQGWNPAILFPFPFVQSEVNKMTNDDLDDYATITPIVDVAYQGGAKFMMKNNKNPNAEAFEAGMETGFKYKALDVVNLTVGPWIELILFDHNGNQVQKETISAQILNLSLGKLADGTVSVKAKVPFSGCEIRFLTVVGLKVGGGMGIHYGFVKLPPDVSHRCQINPTISSNICGSQTSFTLRSNPEVSVTWSLVNAWDLKNNDILATTPVKVTSAGQVTNLEPGKYTFRATAQDGCYDETTITVGGFNDGNTTCGKPLVNKLGEDFYEVSPKIHESSGSLLSISELKDRDNIIKGEYDQYAEYIGGLSLADNLCIIGIHRKDGQLIYDATDRHEGESETEAVKRAQPKRIGFVVEADATVINLHALQFLQIRCYNQGKEVYRHLIDENNAISADIAGSDKLQKIRYSIEVPAYDSKGKQIQMDEFQLWNSGVLNLGGSKLRIYYAFIEEAADDCSSPLACSSMVMSHNHSHTTINANETKFGGVVSVATVDDNLGYLVDDDLKTYMAVANTVSVGVGQTFAVKMGRTLDYHHQLGIVIDNKTFLAAVKVGNWLTLETFKDGNSTGDKFTDWKVISADVAGYGDKNILFLQPKKAYDEVRLTLANIVGALDVQKLYGLVTRGDIDNDGIPDCKDDNSCVNGVKDIVVNNVCVGDTIVVTATGLTGTNYYLSFDDKNAGNNGQMILVESTSDTKNNIKYSYKTKKPGEYQLTFFDGSKTPLTSVVYQVHPLQTRWLATATTNEWNKWDNWSDGSPYCCTNAIISSDADNFPVLGTAVKPADYCCKDIFFEPRSAVDNVPSLNYRKAWVELEQKPNHYYLLSAPLKQMYTGDMFMPADTTKAKYFEELNEENWKEQRFNPSIYQRLWAAAHPGKIYSLDSNGNPVLTDKTLAVNKATWSHNFNAVAKPYGMGEGFSMWIDNGNLPATNKFSIRLPKAHKKYSYFVDYDQEKVASETVTKDANKINRFIYEPDSPQEGNLTMEYKYLSEGKEVTENRTVFVGQSEYQITLKSDIPTQTFVLGNPFMSRLNIKKFLEVNENVSSVKVEVENESGGMEEQTVSKVASTGNATTIAPMQAFYVTTNDKPSTQITLLLTPEMIGGSKKATEDSKPAEAKGLKVCVESLKTRSKSAAMLVMENSETAYDVSDGSSFKNSVLVPTLLDSEVKSPLKVFGIQQSQAYDILPMTGATSLGIYLSQKDSIRIEVKPIQGVDMSGYVLHDMLSGADYSLDSPLIIADAETSLGRFVIRSRYGSTDVTSVDTDQRISIVQEGSSVLVQSAGGLLKSVKVIDLNGRIISRVQGNGSRCLKASIATGIQIIHIELTDGSSKDYKMIF